MSMISKASCLAHSWVIGDNCEEYYSDKPSYDILDGILLFMAIKLTFWALWSAYNNAILVKLDEIVNNYLDIVLKLFCSLLVRTW
jgi:hypothetical protein